MFAFFVNGRSMVFNIMGNDGCVVCGCIAFAVGRGGGVVAAAVDAVVGGAVVAAFADAVVGNAVVVDVVVAIAAAIAVVAAVVVVGN